MVLLGMDPPPAPTNSVALTFLHSVYEELKILTGSLAQKSFQ